MTPQKIGWQRRWQKLYEEIVGVLKTEFVSIWRNFGFQVQTDEKPNEITATINLNGEIVRSLRMQLKESWGRYRINFFWGRDCLIFSLKRFFKSEKRRYWYCMKELMRFTENAVMEAAVSILSKHLQLKTTYGVLENVFHAEFNGKTMTLEFWLDRDRQTWTWIIRAEGRKFEFTQPTTESPINAENLVNFVRSIMLEVAL